MGANITADQIVNHNLVAKGNVNGYDGINGGNIVQTFTNGATIGNVYSYVQDNSGQVWWMFYASPQAYDAMTPFYVKHDASLLDCPDLPGIMAQIAAAAEQAAIAEQGAIPYYLDKYLPWIVGGVVAAFVLPSLLKSKNVSGMEKKNKNMLLIGGAAVVAYFLFIKKSTAATTVATPGVTPTINSAPQNLLSSGSSILTNALNNMIAPLTPATNNPQYATVPITSAGQQLSYDPTTAAAQQISDIGPLPVTYEPTPVVIDESSAGMNGRNGKGFSGKFTN